MKFRIFVFVAIAVAFFAVTSSAQVKTPKFTSVYTSLKTTCKDHDGSNGSDGYSICKGPLGYQIRVYYSASTTQIGAELKGKDDHFPVATAAIDFNWDKSKVEWRLANGKPFALIMRIPKYAAAADGEYFGKVNGQELVVTGLKGFESLSTKIDAKTTGSNGLAREAADSAYLSKN